MVKTIDDKTTAKIYRILRLRVLYPETCTLDLLVQAGGLDKPDQDCLCG